MPDPLDKQLVEAVLTRPRRKKNDRHRTQRGMTPQTPAYIQPVAPRNHDVQQKQGRSLPLRIRNNVCRIPIHPHSKSGRFQMMLHQPRNVRVVFQHKYCLAQPCTLVNSRCRCVC